MSISTLDRLVQGSVPGAAAALFSPMTDQEFATLPVKWPDAIFVRSPDGGAIRVDFPADATAAQKSAVGTAIKSFDPNAPDPRARIPKSVVVARLTDPQLDAALAAMTNRQKERWRAPDHPTVYADDPETVGLIKAVGADPNVVLAP